MNAPQKRILVIDDEDAIRKSFALALEDSGYGMDAAASGAEGLERFRTGSHDLVFLDLKMPGLNGAETLLALRKMDPAVPIFIVTAFYEEFFDDLKEAREKGVHFELMRKPVGADQIVMVARGILENQVLELDT